ncbi:collectin-12-like [Stigmatopora argus]
MKDDFADEDEVQSFGYKRFAIQEGTHCTKCKKEWALKTSIALLYVLCTLLGVAVALLGYKVVQRVDSVSAGIANYGGKIVAVESDLKKLDDQSGETSENATTAIRAFKTKVWTLQRQLSVMEEHLRADRLQLSLLQNLGLETRGEQASVRGLLDADAAALRSLNGTLRSYDALLGGLRDHAARLQEEVRRQGRLQDQVWLTVDGLNHTQTRQGVLLEVLRRSVDDGGRDVQGVRADLRGLEQSAEQTRSDAQWLRGKLDALQTASANASLLSKANDEGLEEVGSRLTSLSGRLQNADALADAHERSLKEILERQRDLANLTSSDLRGLEARLDRTEGGLDRVTANVSYATQLLGAVNRDLNALRGYSETVARHSEALAGLGGGVAEAKAEAGALRSRQEEMAARLDREVTGLSVVVEEMKLVDAKHSQLITNFTILQGPPGPRGSRGDRGPTGPTGQSGQKGEKGDKGASGIRGPRGEQGTPGPPGLPGLRGLPGVPGSPGSKGPRGSGGRAGPPGGKGEPGAAGLPGRDGQPGPQGAQGPPGIRGSMGPAGELGGQGPAGPPGNPGPPGPPAAALSPAPLQDVALAAALGAAAGCPPEWLGYGNKCYLFSKDLHSFDDAEATCQLQSASLLTVDDAEEQKWLQKQIQDKGYFWMALTDRAEENVWRWLDGTRPAFTKWKPGQPDNWGHGHESGENCAGLIHDGLWNDFSCEDLISYICQKPHTMVGSS